jgi:hypothetical protein
MEQKWLRQKVAMKARLDRLNPDDTLGREKINKDYAVLRVIGLAIRRQLEKASHAK